VFYILMLLGVYGLLFELQNPGATLPGVVGIISLLLALYAASVLPLNALGVALILLAFALFIADLFAPSHGILTAGAIVSFAIGSLILFQADSPVLRVSLWLVGTMTALTTGLFVWIAYSGRAGTVSAQRERLGATNRSGGSRASQAEPGGHGVRGWRALARHRAGSARRGGRICAGGTGGGLDPLCAVGATTN
jgi:membrane-bound serine protease (ClpP class)